MVLKKKNKTQKKEEPVQAKKMSGKKKMIMWLIMFLLPIILVVLLEITLRFTSIGKGHQLATKIERNGKLWWKINTNIALRYFISNPDFVRTCEESFIHYKKPDNGFRLICLGGSSMAGFPYNYNATMPGILYNYLKTLKPEKEIEVVNLGIAATNSYTVRDLIADALKLDPDAILIYSGHNEFYGALGVGSSFSMGQNQSLINLTLDLSRFRTYNVFKTIMQKIKHLIKTKKTSKVLHNISVMERMSQHKTIPFGSDMYRAAGENFKKNLESAVGRAVNSVIPVFIGTLVSNEKDHSPFISEASTSTTELKKTVVDLLNKEQYEKILDLLKKNEASTADLCYFRGRALYEMGEYLEAGVSFKKARDLDLLRFRAPGYFNDIIRAVAKKDGVFLVDVEEAFRQNSPEQIIGKELITEHLHPRVEGNCLMAKTFLAVLLKKNTKIGKISSSQIDALPSEISKLHITPLDLEIGRIRVNQITSEWPFKTIINLPVNVLPENKELIFELADNFISMKENWEGSHMDYGLLLSKKGMYHEAISEFNSVLSFYPKVFLRGKESRILFLLANAQISLSQFKEAEKTLKKVIQFQIRLATAKGMLGWAYLMQGNYHDAENQLREAVQLDNKKKEFTTNYRSLIHYFWGVSLLNINKLKEAEIKVSEALRLNPQNKQALDFLPRLKSQIKGQLPKE